MEIVVYPDPRLLARNRPIEEVSPEIRAKVAEMLELMYGLRGVGLAAPQVGWNVRLFVMNPSGDPGLPEHQRVLINPRINRRRGREYGQEGCLSFPEMYVDVERAKSIAVEYTDHEGQREEHQLSDFEARVVQHELDHLDCILLVHRMTQADKIQHRPSLERLERAYSDQVAKA